MFIKNKNNIQYILDTRPFIEQLHDIVKYCRNVVATLKQVRLKPLMDWIIEQTPLLADDVYTIQTKIYWVLNGINSWEDDRVKCSACRKPFIGKNVIRIRLGYSNRCSVACMNSDPNHIKQVVQAQCDHIIENPNFWHDRNEKSKATKIKSGHSWNWTNIEKSRKTKLNKYNDATYNNIDKAKQTRYAKTQVNGMPPILSKNHSQHV